ncbi:DNA polymerase IV [Gordonia sp. CPCC 205333]|uniref:DNA polymerase IV n=1 Tax=Gordonia sp. CPCC 205333 TaxID=3140790 RepID=UPI003AF3BC82
MDAFFASVEELTRPTLAGRPVLVGGLGGRGVVAGASYAAREFGARSAMPMHQARRLVGAGAVVLPPRGSVYRVVSERVFGIVRQEIPTIEMLSFDEAFGEPEALVGATARDVVAFAERLRARITAEVGLTASVGVGSGKQIAKIASGMAKPDGVMAIPPSRELEFLHALPVRKLWGIGPVSGDRLARLGIDTIGDLAAMSPVEVSSVLGATIGPALHRLAKGIDDRPVAERASAKQISSETTLAQDIIDLPTLRREITKIASDAHRRLISDGRGARTIVLKLKKSDMSILTRSATLPGSSVDVAVLTAAAQRLALDPMDVGPIRLVGVGYSGLTAVEQFSLDFDGLANGASSVGEVVLTSDDQASEQGIAVPTESAPQDSDTPELVAAQQQWPTGLDVVHGELGHGWVQGSGHGVVTVRFETRASGPGRAVTFRLPIEELKRADPLDCLDW